MYPAWLCLCILPLGVVSILKTPSNPGHNFKAVTPPPTPDPQLECFMKELLLNTSMLRLPWLSETYRVYDALQLGVCPSSVRPSLRPGVPLVSPTLPGAAHIYAHAEKGLDTNPGTSPSAPLRTLSAARDAARALRKLALSSSSSSSSSTFTTTVVHLAGTFYPAHPLVLDTPLDSHTEWGAWGSTEEPLPVISGGVPLGDLTWGPSPLYPNTPILSTPLPPTAPSSGQLFTLFDASPPSLSPTHPTGLRLPAAREPNGDAELDAQPKGWALSRGTPPGHTHLAPPPGSPQHIAISTPTRNNSAFPGWGYDQDPRNPGVGYVWYGEGGQGVGGWWEGGSTFWANKTLPGGLLWNTSGGVDPRSGYTASPFNASGWAAVVNPPGRRRAHVFHDSLWGNWVFEVASVDPEGSGGVVFSRGGWQEGRGGGMRTQPFFIEGEQAALDSPGEWWVEPPTPTLPTGALHLWPNATAAPPGNFTAPPPTLLVLPVLESVVQVGGGVSGVAFTSLTFTHTTDGLMEGYRVPEAGDWSLRVGGAVEVGGNASGTTFVGCVWVRVGGNGLVIKEGAQDTRVNGGDFRSTGSSGIVVVGIVPYANRSSGSSSSDTDSAAPAVAQYPQGVTISSTLFEGMGVYGKQSSALFVSGACGVVLQDSVLYSGPRAGVNLNDGFCGGHQLRDNVIFDWTRETQDHGPVNTWHRSMYINPEDPSKAAAPQWIRIVGNGIFNGPSPNRDLGNLFPSVDNDDGSSQMWVQGNVMLYGGTKNYLGQDKVWDSNLIIFPSRWSGDSCLTAWRGTGHVFTNNTCYMPSSDSPNYFDSSPAGASCLGDYSDPTQAPFLPTFARNTYGTYSGELHTGCDGNLTLGDLQALGQEVGSRVLKGYSVGDILALARQLLGA